MRRLYSIFTIVALLLLPLTVVRAVEDSKADSIGAKRSGESISLGVHPWKVSADALPQKKAHWSVAIDAGFDFLHADQRQLGLSTIKGSEFRPFGSVMFEYDFSPILGLAFGYGYSNYGVKRTADDWLVYGHLHNAEALFTIDITDAWFPRRRTNVFNLYLFAGGGAGFYKATYNDGLNPILYTSDNGKYKVTPFVALGGMVEFNLSRGVALGLKAEYHLNGTDYLETQKLGSTNDNMTYCSAQLRWKIGARHRNHVRNYAPYSLPSADDDSRNPNKAKGLKDTLVISQVDTVLLTKATERIVERQYVEINNIGGGGGFNDQRYYVYFASDKDVLDRFALQSIQQVASILNDNDDLAVAITGYCDNTASLKHNEALSKRRAQRVYNELTRVHHISTNRVVQMGLGVLHNVDASYAPNRRVEMKIVTLTDLPQLAQQKDSLETLYNTTVQKATPRVVSTLGSQSDIANQTIIESNDTVMERTVETYTPTRPSQEKQKVTTTQSTTQKKNGGIIAKVTVDANTTLMKLAKQYYGNGDFWVFIYEANKKVIESPNRLKKGTVLVIPELTPDQKKMSKRQLEALANKYLQ